jgi:Fic family protein
MIKAIAFLRQLKKEIYYENTNGTALPFIKVELEDIHLANKLAHEILGHSLDELSRPGRDLLAQLEELISKRKEGKGKDEPMKQSPSDTLHGGSINLTFSRRDIREHTGWSNARVHRYLKELLDLEYVLTDSGRNGTLCRYRLVYEGQGKDGKKFFLGLAEPEKLR